jgi:hypothetical protein
MSVCAAAFSGRHARPVRCPSPINIPVTAAAATSPVTAPPRTVARTGERTSAAAESDTKRRIESVKQRYIRGRRVPVEAIVARDLLRSTFRTQKRTRPPGEGRAHRHHDIISTY